MTNQQPDVPNQAGGRSPESDRSVLVPVNEYRPGTTARVVDRLPATIVVELLRLPNGETVPVLTRPDEYTGYVVRSEFGGEQVRWTTIVFTREALESDSRYVFEADAQVYSTQLSLLETTVRHVGSAGDGCGNAPASSSEQR